MDIKIREASKNDFDRLEKILLQNEMLSCPEIDGKEAMYRIHEIAGRYFFIAEVEGIIVGMIRGCYDGSRVLIHQMAVDKNYQRNGIGKRIIQIISVYYIYKQFLKDLRKMVLPQFL